MEQLAGKARDLGQRMKRIERMIETKDKPAKELRESSKHWIIFSVIPHDKVQGSPNYTLREGFVPNLDGLGNCSMLE